MADRSIERTDRTIFWLCPSRRNSRVCPAAVITGQSSQAEPVRIEFFGDQIESIRVIDLDTQRSGRQIGQIRIAAPAAQDTFDNSELLIRLLPKDTLIILEEPLEIAEVSDVFFSRVEDPRGLYRFEAIYRAIREFTCLEISRFAGAEGSLHLEVVSAQEFEHKSQAAWKDHKQTLQTLLERAGDHQVHLYCENHAEIQRTREILKESVPVLPDSFHLPLGFIRQGFIIRSLKTIVLSHHEVFGRYSVRRRIRSIRTASPVDSLLDLQKGDIVVHVSYGIGKYIGIEMLEKEKGFEEYLTLEYADKVKIHVPVSSIHLVHKFVGALPRRPSLSKIGAKKWQQQKEKVSKNVQELAAELLEVRAKRLEMGGFSFGPDTSWQKEFEQAFLYEETPDQLAAAENQTRHDRRQAHGSALCGDVGYGKTELAMRAAFRPSTPANRLPFWYLPPSCAFSTAAPSVNGFADFPVQIAILNRFTTPGEARRILSEPDRENRYFDRNSSAAVQRCRF